MWGWLPRGKKEKLWNLDLGPCLLFLCLDKIVLKMFLPFEMGLAFLLAFSLSLQCCDLILIELNKV